MTASQRVPLPTPDALFARIDAAATYRRGSLRTGRFIAFVALIGIRFVRRGGIAHWATIHDLVPSGMTAWQMESAVRIAVFGGGLLALLLMTRLADQRVARATGSACPGCGAPLRLHLTLRSWARRVSVVRDRNGAIALVRCPKCDAMVAQVPAGDDPRDDERRSTTDSPHSTPGNAARGASSPAEALPTASALRARIDAATEDAAGPTSKRRVLAFLGIVTLLLAGLTALQPIADSGALDWLLPREYHWVLALALMGVLLYVPFKFALMQDQTNLATSVRHGATCPSCRYPLSYIGKASPVVRTEIDARGICRVRCGKCGALVAEGHS